MTAIREFFTITNFLVTNLKIEILESKCHQINFIQLFFLMKIYQLQVATNIIIIIQHYDISYKYSLFCKYLHFQKLPLAVEHQQLQPWLIKIVYQNIKIKEINKYIKLAKLNKTSRLISLIQHNKYKLYESRFTDWGQSIKNYPFS